MVPFHYAFAVRDLESTRGFYVEVLGCREGRSAPTWIDLDFFGHQLSAHVGEPAAATGHGHVNGVEVPLPHFGAILDGASFAEVAARLRAADVRFVIEPSLRYAGEPGEQVTMFFLDPSGNALELKSFAHAEHVFTP